MDNHYLTLPEACNKLGMTLDYIRLLIRTRKLRSIRRYGRRLISDAEVERYNKIYRPRNDSTR